MIARFYLALLMITMGSYFLGAQSSTETFRREFTGHKTLQVSNINGSVEVTGYEGDVISVEVEKTIKAKSEDLISLGKQEITVGVIDRVDTVILYVDGSCLQFGRRPERSKWFRSNQAWSYYDNLCDKQQGWSDTKGYDYRLNFKVKVPQHVNVLLSTINQGDIQVQHTLGAVVAENINGGVHVDDVSGRTEVSSINGPVEVSYSAFPPDNCRYYALNGDINVRFPDALNAQISFKSFNGSLYSNIASFEPLPIRLEKEEGKKGIRYKITGNHYKVGSGGVDLAFETFNGSAYVIEKNLKK